ncbi:ABC transporter permease subunit [Hymenobacter koreensis]|uniref:ABC transporter permease n=1 Tax=Hymenobacter koreensis TaxID=1084523 RepID=A0ABP8J2F5_9BACT
MLNLLAFMLRDLLRNRTVLAYAGLLLLLSTGLWWLDPAPERLALNLVNVTLLFVPLYTVIFTITYFHNSRDFTELLVVLPLPRRAVLLGQLGAVLLALSAALLVGLGLPLLLLAGSWRTLTLVLTGVGLTWVFVALSYALVLFVPEKIKSIGLGLVMWFALAVLYDGLVLALLYWFSDYPIEAFVVPVASLNPLDLARIVVLLQFDTAALMGYTGAVYQDFFGSHLGILVASTVLLIWVAVPLLVAVRRFKKMDL